MEHRQTITPVIDLSTENQPKARAQVSARHEYGRPVRVAVHPDRRGDRPPASVGRSPYNQSQKPEVFSPFSHVVPSQRLTTCGLKRFEPARSGADLFVAMSLLSSQHLHDLRRRRVHYEMAFTVLGT